MPAGRSEIQHAAVTDHRIRRSPSLIKTNDKAHRSPTDTEGLRPYVLYHENDRPRDDPDRDRDYGIALMESARLDQITTATTPLAARQVLAQAVLPLLEPAVRRDTSDLDAQEARAAALWLNEQFDDAARAYESLLCLEPKHEIALREAARLALETNRPRQAVELGRRLVAVSPYRWQYHSQLALALLSERQSKAAQAACEAALEVYPLAVEPRKYLVAALLDQGEREKADKEFRLLLELSPPDRTALEAWYAERTKQPAR
jgi:tetratricopeptide (TPR) repeat protein